MKGLLVTAAFRAGWALARLAPEQVAVGAFQWGADLATRRGGPGVEQLRRNLARVVPRAGAAELDDLVARGMRSYARYWCETFRLRPDDVDAVHQAVERTATGQENLHAACAEGNGVILALPHCGSWDLAGVWLLGHSRQVSVVVQRLRPESLYRSFTRARERLGFDVVPSAGGEIRPTEHLAQRLRAGGVVCLFADRDLTANGVPVTFFGGTTRMPAGPAYLAATTGATLLPVGTWFTETGWGLRVHPPVKVNGIEGIGAATQALADVFAADIAAHPEDWHMLQRLWLAEEPAQNED
ncbi:phosphatidylinositol mannoside acyltransferase [Kutzneria buriramensis]|uniref:KDO2-lipid IV(A) lauroyltransferase n=1 Tax=Kutzneria buriramensis TaxID=1045776 RepID=A0A3E0HFT6_9PSEU|nr:phosphatidylinositol mannoside acyltransferase [Kutzneria buriramensis]REH44613.1 KDO2-lipid IV(A) lauroyltransferase [Kutzneria buriramensis]